MRLAFWVMTAGLFAAGMCIWTGAGSYGTNSRVEPQNRNREPAWATIERTRKSDRLVSSVKSAPNASGFADSAFAAIEVAGPLVSAVVVRDHNGRVLYSADPATRTTLIAKRPILPTSFPPAKDRESLDPKEVLPPGEMPDGCEGAFSPYAAPRMARIIGRCISAIEGNRRVASAQ